MARNSGHDTPRMPCFLLLKPDYKTRNWVAKYALRSGAGKHKAGKQKPKHKLKEIPNEDDNG
jgi:hypothetical protein